MELVLGCYSLNGPSDLIDGCIWLAYGYGLVQRLLRDIGNLRFDLMLGLSIEDSKIVVSVVPVYVYTDVDVDLVAQLKRACGWYSMDVAFID